MNEFLELLTIDVVEGGGGMRVEIEHRSDGAGGVLDGNDDLRPRGGIAGDVSLERLDVGDDLGLTGASGRAADAPLERDVDASDGTLEGADSKQPRRHHSIEAGPAGIGDGGVDCGRDVGHGGDRIGADRREAVDLEPELSVGLPFLVVRHPAILRSVDRGRLPQ